MMKRKLLPFLEITLLLFCFSVTTSKSQTIFTVGGATSGTNYSTIQAAYNACTGSTSYQIQVKSNYTGAETFPINLTQLANKSSTNTVTIYPQTGVTGFIFSKTTTIFSFNGADYVTIDGRAGRTGPIVWTLQNTSVTAAANTVQFINDATNNLISYCNIYGSSTGSAANNGVIIFGAASTSGNNNNSIFHNTIGKDNITAMPYQAISFNGTSGMPNMGTDIRYNNIQNFSNKGVFIDSINGNSDQYLIWENSFYQTANFTVGSPIIVMDIGMGSFGGYTSAPNYIGGQAPNCGGSPFVIPSSGTSSFIGVLFRKNVSYGQISASINNITLSTTMATGIPFIGIEARCGYISIDGSSIGSNCSIVNNATGGSLGIEGIRILCTSGTSTINSSFVGGFTLSGARNGAASTMVNCLSGSTGVNSSTINGATVSSVSDLTLVNCEVGASVSFNSSTVGGTTHNGTGLFTAIRNKSTSGISFYKSSLNTISLPNTLGTIELLGIDNQAGPLDINFSSFYGLTTANNAPLSVIKHTGTTLTIKACTFDTYTQSNTGTAGVLKVVNINSASAAIVNNNVFGNTTAGNISTTANAVHFIISNIGAGGLTTIGNTFNGYAIGGAGNAVALNSIYTTQGSFTCIDNTFQNSTINTITTGDFASIFTTAATNAITNNTIKNIQFTNATVVASSNRAIFLGGTSSGTLSKNFITGLTSASTSTSAKIIGIDIFGGSWNLYNNAILFNNSAATNALTIYGIWSRNTTGSNAIYHNTVKLYGTQTGNASSASMIRTAASTNNVRNNVFQNLRTGGTLGHYAESATATGYTTDYNYLEASNVNQLGSYAGADKTLATWKTSALANNSITGTTTFDNTGRQAAGFVGASSGTNLLATVPDDRTGAMRITTPALGAYQSAATTISITSFSPQIGPIGTVVTINGTGFSSVTTNNVVRFGGVKANVTAATPTQLTVTVPAGASYTSIVVVANGLLVETTKPFHVTNASNCVYFELPKIAGTGGYNGLVGDCNNDGNPDLFSKINGQLRVLLGDGTGNYPTYTGYGLNSNTASQFETGDFNRDGQLDLIDLDYGGSIFMNVGGGTFSAAEFTIATGGSTAMGDINKDGILDWVSVNGGSLIYAYGYGNSFGPYNYTSAPGSVYVQLADFNSDGYLDVVTSNDNSYTISIFLGSSTGTYTTKTDYTSGTTGPFSSTIGDYDKDGDLDIAVANDNNKSFSVFLNAGLNTATFPTKVDYTSTSVVKFVETADINGDGNLDLIISNENEFTVSIFFGTGTGSFGTRQDFPIGMNPRNLTVGDFNKDGKQDLLCSDVTSLIVLLNTCTSPAPQITTFSPLTGVVGTTVTINGRFFDPTPANNKVYFGSVAAVVTASTSTQLTVTVPSGVAYDRISVVVNGLRVISKTHFDLAVPPVTCVTTTSFDPKVDLTAGSNINSMVMGDLNGDGKNDLVSVNNGSNSVSVYMNTSVVGTISYAAPVNITTGASPYGVALGDIDGDGKLDMAVTNGSTNVTVYRNTGAGAFAVGVNFTTNASGAGLAIGDIDQDGKPDLMVGYNSTSTAISLYKNQSVSGTINASSFAAKYDLSTRNPYNLNIALNDFNNDGKMDIVVSQNSTGNVNVMRNTGISGTIGLSSGFYNFSPTAVGTSPKEVFTGDVDGDGKPDVVVANSGGTNVSILRNTATSISSTSFAAVVNYTTANTPSAVAMGDIDGDGKSDILVANYGSNSMSVLKNNSTSGTINFAAKVDIVNGTGTNPSAIAVGDMDSDGKPDVALGAFNNGSKISVFKNRILPTATISGTTTICNGASVNLSVAFTGNGAPWSFTYSNGSTNTTVSGILTTPYTLTLSPTVTTTYTLVSMTSAYTCTGTVSGTAIVTVNPLPTVTGTTGATRCGIGTVTISGTVSNNSIRWYTVPTGGVPLDTSLTYLTPTLASNTSYYAEAFSSQSCASATRTQVNVVVNAISSITSLTPASRCDPGPLTLSVTTAIDNADWWDAPVGGTKLVSKNNTYAISSIAVTDTFYVDVTYGICTSTPRMPIIATVTPSPSIASAPNGARCGNGTVLLTANSLSGGGVIKWYAALTGGASLQTGGSYTTNSISNTTSYYVEVTENGCTSAPRKLVNAIVNPIPTFTISSSNPTACATPTGSFTISGLTTNSPYTFNYSSFAAQAITTDGFGNYSQLNLPSGSYTGINVTDAKGCVSTNASTVLVDPGGPPISVSADIPNPCQGNTVILTATNPNGASLLWGTGETTPTVSLIAAGSGPTTYTVTGTLAGCKTTSNVVVTVRKDQTIVNYNPIGTKDVYAAPFSISAGTSSGLIPVVFTSLDLFVATVSGNIVTIVGPGTARIMASQAGDACFNPVDSIQSFLVTGTLDQKITFGALPTIAFGDVPFALGATVNSPNSIVYEISDTTIAKVVSGNAIGLKAGTVMVKAYALGSTNYNPSDTVVQYLTVIIPPFKIFGSTIVQGEQKENYFVSPNSPKYSYAWYYKGSNTYFVSDTISRNVGIYFTKTATGDTLRCRIYSIASTTYVDVFMKIQVNPDIAYLPPVNCDSLKGTFTICSGKFINNFALGTIANPNSGCDQGYSDFTRLGNIYTTDLYLGDSYNALVQIVNNAAVNLSANYIGVWLDYNNNGSFDDPNEFLISTYSADSTIELKNLLISTDEEYAGVRRLRIRVRSSGLFTFNESCVDFNETGETEDYKITLVIPDRLQAPVLLSPNEDGKNDLFIIKGIYNKPGATENRLTIMDRMGNVLVTKTNYSNDWDGKGKDDKLLPRDTYYYNFVNGDNEVIRGYFEIRYE